MQSSAASFRPRSERLSPSALAALCCPVEQKARSGYHRVGPSYYRCGRNPGQPGRMWHRQFGYPGIARSGPTGLPGCLVCHAGLSSAINPPPGVEVHHQQHQDHDPKDDQDSLIGWTGWYSCVNLTPIQDQIQVYTILKKMHHLCQGNIDATNRQDHGHQRRNDCMRSWASPEPYRTRNGEILDPHAAIS